MAMQRCLLPFLVLLHAGSLMAAGNVIGITISAPEIITPIRLTEGVDRFQVWAGPGTSTNEPQSLIVDWAAGSTIPPQTAPVYRVTFETTRRNPSSYIVFYTIDAATGKGYAYIPGRNHPAYRDNTWLIFRGVEGQWFRAWSEWEKLANPLIEKAPRIR